MSKCHKTYAMVPLVDHHSSPELQFRSQPTPALHDVGEFFQLFSWNIVAASNFNLLTPTSLDILGMPDTAPALNPPKTFLPRSMANDGMYLV